MSPPQTFYFIDYTNNMTRWWVISRFLILTNSTNLLSILFRLSQKFDTEYVGTKSILLDCIREKYLYAIMTIQWHHMGRQSGTHLLEITSLIQLHWHLGQVMLQFSHSVYRCLLFSKETCNFHCAYTEVLKYCPVKEFLLLGRV